MSATKNSFNLLSKISKSNAAKNRRKRIKTAENIAKRKADTANGGKDARSATRALKFAATDAIFHDLCTKEEITVLSFDCATTKMGVSLITFRGPFHNVCNKKGIPFSPENINENEMANIHAEVIFLMRLNCAGKEGRNASTIRVTKGLKLGLAYINSLTDTIPDLLLLEFQMNTNDKARIIEHQILYEYTNIIPHIYIIHPSVKNKLEVGHSLSESNEKYSSQYDANKDHAYRNALNCLKYMDLHEGICATIEGDIIVRGELSMERKEPDVSDALCQTLAFLSPILHKDS
jgi:hypothetical protein